MINFTALCPNPVPLCRPGVLGFQQPNRGGEWWFQEYCDPGLTIDPEAVKWEAVDDINTFHYNVD